MNSLVKQYLLHVSYFGAQYGGVVFNKNVKSVGQCIHEALQKFLPKIEPYGVYVSSRTDKGVNAFANTFRFTTRSPLTFNVSELRRAMNNQFSYDKELIRVHQIKEIESTSNIIDIIARRTYLYRIAIMDQTNTGLECLTAWESGQIFFVEKPFDMAKFSEVASLLSGQMDYSGFTNLGGTLSAKSTVKNLKIDIKKSESSILNMHSHPILRSTESVEYYDLFISAESFMNKMVRYLVGCMVSVARGEVSMDIANDVCTRGCYYLQEKPFECAPPYALYLYKINHKDQKYDFDINQWKEEMNFEFDQKCGWNRPLEFIESNVENKNCDEMKNEEKNI